MRLRIALFCAPLCVTACVYLPYSETRPNSRDDFRDAIGTVTASSPLFTPLQGIASPDTKLQFGALRDEQKLAEAINRPSMSITNLQFSALQAAISARLPTATESVTQTLSQKVAAEQIAREYREERSRSFDSGSVPESEATQLQAPDGVDAAMQKLLGSSGANYHLAPDQVATLVAAYKTYMVNLEEYYNVAGYGFERGNTAEFVPYKVHFTVTAEPGWYTRYRQYDAVTELTFGGESSQDDFRVLAVTPPETAQTINQLTASLEKLDAALQVEGTVQAVGVNAATRMIQQAAERLEGLRTNKTLVVGFPAHNKARIRFRPSIVPTETEQDLQPRSRILTAIVLVRNKKDVLCGNRTVTEMLSFEPGAAEDVNQLALQLESLKKSLKDGSDPVPSTLNMESLLAADWRDRVGPLKTSNGTERERYDALSRLADTLHKEHPWLCQGTETHDLTARKDIVQQHSYFAAGLRDQDGKFAPPRVFLHMFNRDTHRYTLPPTQSRITIPAWRGVLDKRVKVEKVSGYYWANMASLSAARSANARAQAKSTKAATAAAAAKKAHDAIVAKIAELKKKLVAATGLAAASLNTQIRDAEKKEPGLKTKAAEKKKEAADMKTAAQKKRDALDFATQVVLECGHASIGARVVAPRWMVWNGRPLPTRTWLRVVGAKSAANSWRSVGEGDIESAFQFAGIDLGESIVLDDKGKPTHHLFRGFLEATVCPVGIQPKTVEKRLVKRAILNFTLDPRSRKLTADKPAAATTSTAKPVTIPLDVSGAKLKLSPPPTSSTPATNTTPAKSTVPAKK